MQLIVDQVQKSLKHLPLLQLLVKVRTARTVMCKHPIRKTLSAPCMASVYTRCVVCMLTAYIYTLTVQVASSLLRNSHVHLELYLHQLMPALLTCLVAKRLGSASIQGTPLVRTACLSLLSPYRKGRLASPVSSILVHLMEHLMPEARDKPVSHLDLIEVLAIWQNLLSAVMNFDAFV